MSYNTDVNGAAPFSRLTNQAITVEDGRSLGYAEYGVPHGKPVFFFHGWPNSRLEAAFCADSAANVNVRLIGVDRPGYGLSDFSAGRDLLDWPDDVLSLAGKLKIGNFGVLGLSAGGPYAAACAHKIPPHRLSGVAMVSSLGPFNVPELRDHLQLSYRLFLQLTRKFPRVTKLLLSQLMRRQRPHQGSYANHVLKQIGGEKELYADPKMGRLRAKILAEAARSGVQGWVYEIKLLTMPWGFRLKDIPVKVQLWYGREDDKVPPEIGRYLARAIPNCHAHFVEGEGHVSILVHYGEEILRSLLQDSTEAHHPRDHS